MPSIIAGSLMRATPPSRRMSAGTRSSAITATAPASSATRACSGVDDVHDDAAPQHLGEAALHARRADGAAHRASSDRSATGSSDWPSDRSCDQCTDGPAGRPVRIRRRRPRPHISSRIRMRSSSGGWVSKARLSREPVGPSSRLERRLDPHLARWRATRGGRRPGRPAASSAPSTARADSGSAAHRSRRRATRAAAHRELHQPAASGARTERQRRDGEDRPRPASLLSRRSTPPPQT